MLKRDIDFLKAYELQNKLGKQKRNSAIKVRIKILAMACGGVVVVILIVLSAYLYSLHKQVIALREYTENSKDAKTYAYILQKRPEYEQIKRYNDMVEEAKENIELMPKMNQTVYKILKNCLPSEVKIIGTSMGTVDGDNGILVAEVKAKTPRNVTTYVQQLKATDEFEWVAYHGWEENDSEGNIFYHGVIQCALRGGVEQ